MINQNNWPTCCGKDVTGVEYWYNNPNRYDGISEYKCMVCGKRVGRWTGKELQEGEFEPRFGKKE